MFSVLEPGVGALTFFSPSEMLLLIEVFPSDFINSALTHKASQMPAFASHFITCHTRED